MIVRSVDQIAGTERDVTGAAWRSQRLLLRGDGMGFSMSETTVAAGAELHLAYKHHLEACFCIGGVGEIEDLATSERHRIDPGTMYALDAHDRHIVRAKRELRLVCVFNPPLTGRETHDPDGSYRPVAE